jgi:hypothetical protein
MISYSTTQHHYHENIISIYPFLPFLGFFAATVTFGFCLALVLVPFWTNYQGSLGFISDGMHFYCGWSSAVLGSCGLFIGACEFVAALHTKLSSYLLIAILIQIPSWCIIVGVSGTGWEIHYVALALFMCSTLYFHWTFANTHHIINRQRKKNENIPIYYKVNLITALNLFAFFMSFLILFVTKQQQQQKSTTTTTKEIPPSSVVQFTQDIAVSLEVTLLCCITIQTFCLSWVLLQYKNIHILFEDPHFEDDHEHFSSFS